MRRMAFQPKHRKLTIYEMRFSEELAGMKYYSTRNKSNKASSAQAIAQGLASDGGLFVPETIPQVSPEEILELCKMNYQERAVC
ncbi:MAG: hypothetical protein RR743_03875, partial [Oscillospiraceae bacterium]